MNEQLRTIKQRFGIVGFDPMLERAINIAIQVAQTDLSVLVTGESGVGKETFSKIIHEKSGRKGKCVVVNCGAIPEGTIDSELFGHEKGAFTGAVESRMGYFEVANNGTIFLDEVGDLPLATQVRLLRVLESGDFMRVGSAQVQKTNVRIVAATNVNLLDKIAKGQFREDLFYRLNTIPIHVPPLRERKGDIIPLFNKFACDFSDKNHLPPIQLTEESQKMLCEYSWPGNIRQLRNVTDQISIMEVGKIITPEILLLYIGGEHSTLLPVPVSHDGKSSCDVDPSFERELVYKYLYDLREEVAALKTIVMELKGGSSKTINIPSSIGLSEITIGSSHSQEDVVVESVVESVEEPISKVSLEKQLNLEANEREAIVRALEKCNNVRKNVAEELGISERTLYRKIKKYNIQ